MKFLLGRCLLTSSGFSFRVSVEVQSLLSAHAHRGSCRACAVLPGICASSTWCIQNTDPQNELPCCARWQRPCGTEGSPIHRTVVGRSTQDAPVRGWWSALGSVTTRHRGSWKVACIWSVKALRVRLPATGLAPVAAANFSTARWPVPLEGTALAAAGFSKATMA